MKNMTIAGIALSCSVFVATQAMAQFIPNGGQSGSADTSSFGQSDAFDNITTNFDGLRFKLTRLTWEDAKKGTLRLLAKLENVGDLDILILGRWPGPKLIDDLGNRYHAVQTARFGVCKENCWDAHNATRLPPQAEVTVMFVFEPDAKAGFNSELSQIAETMQLTTSYFYGPLEGFGSADAQTVQTVVVGNIPKPTELE